jgi:FMN phosphatase YigB (HAD superfamily)
LSALKLDTFCTSPPTLSWDVEASKPDAAIFDAACKSAGEEVGEGVIMVGDELDA